MAIRYVFNLLSDPRFIFSQRTNSENLISKSLRWERPCLDWTKLNTDGSVTHNPSRASYESVLCSDNGVWCGGFSGKLGCASVMLAELQTIQEGMILAERMNIQQLIVESDSLGAVKLIKESITDRHPYGQVVDDYKTLMHRFYIIKFVYVLQECKSIADFLVNLGHDLLVDFYI